LFVLDYTSQSVIDMLPHFLEMSLEFMFTHIGIPVCTSTLVVHVYIETMPQARCPCHQLSATSGHKLDAKKRCSIEELEYYPA